MELSRRDALAALAAGGGAAGGALTLDRLRVGDGDDNGNGKWHGDGGQDQQLGEREMDTLVAVAEVVYPSVVEGIPAFVETYAVGRASNRPAYAEGLVGAIDALDDAATDWYDGPFRALDRGTRDRLLRELGCDTANPDSAGTTAERLRYYLLNELLYALYTSPTGGALVGLENPQGHPGGTASYQRGPTDE